MCGGFLTGLSGVITSPGYPQEYSNNADCSWAIHVSNNSVVTLVFLDFQLENNEGCNFDFVALFDGRTVTHRHLGKYCGADKPPYIVTTSNQLLVVFKSDFNIGGRGFKAYYYSGKVLSVSDLNQCPYIWCTVTAGSENGKRTLVSYQKCDTLQYYSESALFATILLTHLFRTEKLP